jgi:hypothetical protein
LTTGTANLTIKSDVDRFRVLHKELAKELLRRTSWLKRIKHNAAPWDEDDKTRMKETLDDFRCWNESIYAILPQRIRDSVVEQGIAGYILQDGDDAFPLPSTGGGANPRNTVVNESAELLLLRKASKRK